VADIASELGMRRANVYRFFPSRDAINEAICKRVVNEVADIFAPFNRLDWTPRLSGAKINRNFNSSGSHRAKTS
jgi:AcrR family transcriptional regulator